ncbi:hypothetical protein KKE60_08725, partial [Patescibacteria group bacterium]|nr:hypothetical protein [Patescibacteria group bacterium]
MACMFCQYGHLLECHHPYNCEEANCEHYQAAMEHEQDWDLPTEGEALANIGVEFQERDGQAGLYHKKIGFIPAVKPTS